MYYTLMAAAVIMTVSVPVTTAGDTLPEYSEGPYPVQGLTSFMERQGEKPYDLFVQEDGSLAMHRIIFKDKQFGTEVWMLDDSPTVGHAGTASIWWAWNRNASALYLEGARPLDGSTYDGWFCASDFARMWPARGDRPAVWAPEDPDCYYGPINPVDRVSRYNWRTGEETVLATWDPLSWNASGKRIYGLTTDEQHIFIDLPNRGIFVPFTHDDAHPIPELPLYDGRPVGPGGESVGGNHFCVIYDHAEHGNLIALRTGLLVDRQTGAITNIAAPLCGNTNYLRAFHEGRIHYPQDEEWTGYGLPWFSDTVQLPTDLSMEELYGLWRNIPHVTHGHESPSPGWDYIATDGGATRIAHVHSGETEELRLSPDGSNYHLHWHIHPRFFVGWVRGWHYRRYARPENGNILYQIFSDLTAQPIFDTNHRFNGYYAGGDFSMQSPDATKVHTASSMTGRFRNYIAVMARPRPPEHVSWQADNNAIRLEWKPAAYSREIQGYLVYRSTKSGSDYELRTPTLVLDTEWTDPSVTQGTPYYYVVTAVEYAGLESGYSQEAARAGVNLPNMIGAPLVVYVEAEAALWRLHTADRPGLAVGADRRTASDWYYVCRHPDADTGAATLEVDVSAEEEYQLWARIRSDNSRWATWTFEIDNATYEAKTDARDWTWVRVTHVPVTQPGQITVTFSTEHPNAAIDLIALTTDSDFEPSGPRAANRPPLLPVETLAVENVRPRVNRLQWRHAEMPSLSHYQIYAARNAFDEPTQQYLIGSPSVPAFIDWGLRSGTTYYYAVTAVDRGGQESAPVFATAQTPARTTEPVTLALAFADSKLEGEFEISKGGGLHGPAYIVPQSPDTNRVSWSVSLPHAGSYYIWLRYLHRGSGNRGNETEHAVRASCNGEFLTTLGGGLTDLHVPDALIEPNHPLASRVWTWAWPGEYTLEGVELPAGRHVLTLDNLNGEIRYDSLLITDEPSYRPEDGRLRQR